MKSIQILGLVGGVSKDSLNKKLFHAVWSLAPKDVTLDTFEVGDLPFFNQDHEENPPKIVRDFQERIRSSNAVLFITPEYNRSFPGVLKNALDWGSRPYGQNAWSKKPAGVMGASSGNIGTFGAQHHLRQVLACLNMPTMGQPEFYLNASKSFDENGKLVDEGTKKIILGFWKAFEVWISKWNEFQLSPPLSDREKIQTKAG